MGKGFRLAIVIGCLLATGPAWAGTLYRCDAPDGSRSYVSKRVKGASCTVISRYRPERPRAYTPPAASASAAAPNVSASQEPAIQPVAQPVSAAPAASATPTARKQPRFAGMGVSTTYSYVDANGVRVFSNRRPAGVAKVTVSRTEYPIFVVDTCYACGVASTVNFSSTRLNLDAYRDEIAGAARQYGVDEAIVRAVIHAESAFRPNALSRVGAQGLMQLMPATARRFGVTDAFEPAQNIRGGVQYLSWLLKRFNNDLTLAAAGYNAGEGAVDKYRGVPPYKETRLYVQRVAVLAERYRSAVAVAR